MSGVSTDSTFDRELLARHKNSKMAVSADLDIYTLKIAYIANSRWMSINPLNVQTKKECKGSSIVNTGG